MSCTRHSRTGSRRVADTTKALFVLTILAVPPLGAAAAMLLGGLALGARVVGLAPSWLAAVSAVGAIVSSQTLAMTMDIDIEVLTDTTMS